MMDFLIGFWSFQQPSDIQVSACVIIANGPSSVYWPCFTRRMNFTAQRHWRGIKRLPDSQLFTRQKDPKIKAQKRRN
jgi:hypothetical protein